MNFDVRFHGLDPSEALRAHARQRTEAHLAHHLESIGSVTLRFSDINGPRGGPDKRCQITVIGPGFPTLHIQDTRDDLYPALEGALRRATGALARRLDRRKVRRARDLRLALMAAG